MTSISFNDIINKTKEDKEFPIKYLAKLYNMNNIICDKPLSAVRCYIPLPQKFYLSDIYKNQHKITKSNDNEYIFQGTPGNRIMFADMGIPSSCDYKFPIPFTFPITNENKRTELLSSNIYYYEVTIEEKVNMDYTWQNQCVSIGFGNQNTPFNSHVGWFANSIGFHSDDGTIRYNQEKEAAVISRPWIPGDTAGCGLLFISPKLVRPFFTFNGDFIYMYSKPITITKQFNSIIPAIGYDHPNSITVNFSTKPFKFKIKNLIIANSQNIISTENDFIKGGPKKLGNTHIFHPIFVLGHSANSWPPLNHQSSQSHISDISYNWYNGPQGSTSGSFVHNPQTSQSYISDISNNSFLSNWYLGPQGSTSGSWPHGPQGSTSGSWPHGPQGSTGSYSMDPHNMYSILNGHTGSYDVFKFYGHFNNKKN